MKPVGPFGPELDALRADPNRAPVLRAGDRLLRHLTFELTEAGAQRSEVINRFALAGDEHLQAVAARTTGPQLFRQPALDDLRLTLDSRLPPQRRPVKDRSDPRVAAQLVRLSRPERGGEDENVRLQTLERDDARGRAAVTGGGHQGHRRRGSDLRLASLLEPGLQDLKRIGGRIVSRPHA